MGKEQFISVTHFINPQLFWYHKIDVPNENYHEIIQLEQKLQEIYKNKTVTRNFHPAVGDIVAVNFLSWNKYIRVRVEETAHFRGDSVAYIVWAIDYGFPFQTKLEHIRRMPEGYDKQIDHIRCGGLANLLPGEKEFDFMEGKAKMTIQEHWNQRACESLEKLISDAASVTFVEEFQIPNTQTWGDLKIVNHKGNTFFAGDYLVGINFAVKVEDNFREICRTLKATKIHCWLSNNENCKYKQNTLNCTLPDRRLNSAADTRCDNFSKQKVEDWCERNERAGISGRASAITMASMECPIESAAPSIDDIAFEDSVSIQHQPLFKSLIDTEDLDPDEQQGFMRLAGAITKAKLENNAGRKFIPTPPASAFDIPSLSSSKTVTEDGFSSMSGDSIISSRKQKLIEMRKKLATKQIMEQKQSLNQPMTSAAGTTNNIPYHQLLESSFDETCNLSGVLKETENLKSETEVETKHDFNETDVSETYKNGSISEKKIVNKMQNITIDNTNKSEISVTNARAKQLFEIRRKRIASSSNVSKSQENVGLESTFSHKNVEIPKEIKVTTLSKHMDYEKDNDRDDAISNTSSGAASSYIELLKNTRKRIQEKKTGHIQNDIDQQHDHEFKDNFISKKETSNKNQICEQVAEKNTENFGTMIRNRQDLQFPDYTKESSKQNVSIRNQKTNDPYDGLTMIPAGFDLAKLNRYKDEENHWHRKKSTLNDYVPHDLDVSEELLLNISQTTNSSTSDALNMSRGDDRDLFKTAKQFSSNQNFRHTRSHTDKYKEIHTTSQSEDIKCEKTLLDSTVPDIGEDALKPVINEKTKIEQLVAINSLDESKKNAEKTENEQLLPSINKSDSNNRSSGKDCLQQIQGHSRSLVKTYKRRQLKSPAEQGPKMEQILRRAKFEKELGNTEILDLNALNIGGGKSETDSNSFSDAISENDNSFGSKSSNNNLTLAKSFPTSNAAMNENKNLMDDSDKLKLDRLVEQLHYELNLKKKSPPTTMKKKTSTKIVMPHEQHIREVEGEKHLQTKFIEHLVLAHSNVPLHPLEQLSDAFFLPEIYNEMVNMRVTKVYRIQAYSWSHLLRGNSLFVVNPTKSGKTWCYMPPLCNLVSYRIQNSTIPETFGPVAIVIVHSALHVEHVNNFCRRLVINSKAKVTTVPSYGVRNTNEVKIQLLNSCGILVVTPANLLRLLRDNEHESLIDPVRLQHLVVDDLDLILSRSRHDFETVLRILYKMVKKPKEHTIPLQVVVTLRDWNSVMMSMICWSNQPLLLIGDFLEAAVYGKAEISMKLRSSDKKLTSVMRFLEKHPAELERVLILCNHDNDLDDVVQALTESGYACIGYGNRSDVDVRVTIDEWKMKKLCSQILVCTDSVLPELMLQNVQSLIHFSMPTSWTKFTSRFSTLAQSYVNSVATEFQHNTRDDDTAVARSLILMDEDNNLQLPRLIDFMKKHDQIKNVHPDILAVAKRLLIEREELRILNGTLLCSFFLEFGECDEVRCDYRHNLTRFDAITKKDDIPACGDMRIKILKVFSPTHFTARLLEHKSPITSKWEKIRRSDEAALFGMQLNMYYMNTENWITYWPLKINDLCVYKTLDTYQRVRILDVPLIKHADIVQKVRVTVKLIDLGIVISSCKSDELFVLDEQFKDFPAQAIDIRLIGVVPFDKERTWDSKGTKAVQKWIMTDINKNECVFVDISFALANTVWVKNVIVMERLPTVGQYIYRVNLKRSLVEKNFGCLLTASNNKCQSIREIAEEFGLFEMLDNEEKEEEDEKVELNDHVEKVKEELNDSINLMKFSSNDEDLSSCDAVDISRSKSDKTTKEEDNANAKRKYFDSIEDVNWDDSIESNDSKFIHIPLSSDKTFDEKEKFNSIDSHTNNHEGQSFKHNSTSKTSSLLPNEEWCKLPLHSLAKVEIGDENENGNWTDIYMQHIDKWQMEKFQELTAIIFEHIKKMQKLAENKPNLDRRWLQPKQNCIVKYDDLYCRAKVYGIFGNEKGRVAYRFFLCDYACFVTVNTDELFLDFLYETTCEIVEYTPYQAVHCRLVGIKLNEFANQHSVVKDYLYAYAVSQRPEASSELNDLNIHSFEILLFECDKENDFSSAIMLNKTLLEQNVATLDAETEHFLELMPHVDLSSFNINNAERLKNDFENNNKNGEVASFEELIQIICNANELDAQEALEDEVDEHNQININKTLVETKAMCHAAIEQYKRKNDRLPEKITEIKKEKSVKITEIESITDYVKLSAKKEKKIIQQITNKSSKSISNKNDGDLLIEPSYSNSDDSSKSSCLTSIPPLKTLHKRPQTEWYETDCLIYIAIYAPDIKDYYLEVTRDTVYFAAFINEEKQVLILNLLGTVEPQQVSHEIRGLNVVVRLVKTVFMKWPRLLQQATKVPWLTYNFNAIDIREIEYIQPQQRMNLVFEERCRNKTNFDSDDTSEDEDLYQTFTPIVNSEDFHDPTADIY